MSDIDDDIDDTKGSDELEHELAEIEANIRRDFVEISLADKLRIASLREIHEKREWMHLAVAKDDAWHSEVRAMHEREAASQERIATALEFIGASLRGAPLSSIVATQAHISVGVPVSNRKGMLVGR